MIFLFFFGKMSHDQILFTLNFDFSRFEVLFLGSVRFQELRSRKTWSTSSFEGGL